MHLDPTSHSGHRHTVQLPSLSMSKAAQTDIDTGRQTGRQVGRQTGRQAGRQAGKQADNARERR